MSGLPIRGPGASNYRFNTTASTTATIAPAALTITTLTDTKVYDGTTTAAAIPTVSDMKGTDTVTGLAETYALPNVGTGITLTVATYTVNDGNGGKNHSVSLLANKTGVITASSGASVVYFKEDTTKHGNWIDTYGSGDHDVINGTNSYINLPTCVTVTPAGECSYTWATPSSSATQALEVPTSGPSRIASAWYSNGSFTVDVGITNGQMCHLELYVLDYDVKGRTEQIQLTNAATKAVLSTENVSNFSTGAYMNWTISGNVLITITNKGGPNAVLNGLFLDAVVNNISGPLVVALGGGGERANSTAPGSSVGSDPIPVAFGSNVDDPAFRTTDGLWKVQGSTGGSASRPAGGLVDAPLGPLPDDPAATAPTVVVPIHDLAMEHVSEQRWARRMSRRRRN